MSVCDLLCVPRVTYLRCDFFASFTLLIFITNQQYSAIPLDYFLSSFYVFFLILQSSRISLPLLLYNNGFRPDNECLRSASVYLYLLCFFLLYVHISIQMRIDLPIQHSRTARSFVERQLYAFRRAQRRASVKFLIVTSSN